MLSSDVYFHRVLADIDEMDERIRALQIYLAIKKVNVKLDHQAHLERIRDRFGEFKSRIEQMELDSDLIAVKNQQALETAGQQLIQAVDTLLEALRT
jgi:cell fate (sporulation/competence/biofilm development) regulator YlbF (YheA/YmcA/DUF963 family)